METDFQKREICPGFLSFFLSFFFFLRNSIIMTGLLLNYDQSKVMLVAQTRTKNPLTWIENANP